MFLMGILSLLRTQAAAFLAAARDAVGATEWLTRMVGFFPDAHVGAPVTLHLAGDRNEVRRRGDALLPGQQTDLQTAQFLVDPYHYSIRLQESAAGAPNRAQILQNRATAAARAFLTHQMQLCLRVLRLNPLVISDPDIGGKKLIDVGHRIPGGSKTFDNLLDWQFADPANPTMGECRALVFAAQTQLLMQNAVDDDVIDADLIDNALVITTTDLKYFEMFRSIQTAEKWEGSENTLRGTFKLYHLPKVHAQNEANPLKFWIFYAPNQASVMNLELNSQGRNITTVISPKPFAMMIADWTTDLERTGAQLGISAGRVPLRVLTDDKDRVETGEFLISIQGRYGLGGFMAQTVLQVNPIPKVAAP